MLCSQRGCSRPRTGRYHISFILSILPLSFGDLLGCLPHPVFPHSAFQGQSLSPARQPVFQNCPGRQGLEDGTHFSQWGKLRLKALSNFPRAISGQSCCWKLRLWTLSPVLIDSTQASLPSHCCLGLAQSFLFLSFLFSHFCLLELSSHRPVRKRGRGCPLRRKRGAGVDMEVSSEGLAASSQTVRVQSALGS